MRAATVVQVLRMTCFKFYCMFYFTCDRSFTHLQTDTKRRVELRLGDDEQVGRLERHREFHGVAVVSGRGPSHRRRWRRRIATSRSSAATQRRRVVRSLGDRLGSAGSVGGRGVGRSRSLVERRRRRRRRRRHGRLCNGRMRTAYNIDCDSYYWPTRGVLYPRTASRPAVYQRSLVRYTQRHAETKSDLQRLGFRDGPCYRACDLL